MTARIANSLGFDLSRHTVAAASHAASQARAVMSAALLASDLGSHPRVRLVLTKTPSVPRECVGRGQRGGAVDHQEDQIKGRISMARR